MRQRELIKIIPNEYYALHVTLSSGDGDGGDYPGCTLSIAAWRWYVTIRLPQLVQPYREKVYPQSWDAQTILRLGRDWYWSYDRREFGVSLHEWSYLSITFGRQSDDSSTEQRWVCFLPWAEWRMVRESLYGPSGLLIWAQTDKQRRAERAAGAGPFEGFFKAKALVPKVTFLFLDYDGQVIEAETFIEQREYRRGEKWCKWLGWFWPARTHRSLHIEFNREVGSQKGSRKGGTLGHGIDMLDAGELHEAAFRRYCALHNLTFQCDVSKAASEAPLAQVDRAKWPFDFPITNDAGGAST